MKKPKPRPAMSAPMTDKQAKEAIAHLKKKKKKLSARK
jgi:hypothetical protein|tara:strand:- start:6162 stop:6275 length:114 start_codon:yes stop_codon:yes gene_type:complete